VTAPGAPFTNGVLHAMSVECTRAIQICFPLRPVFIRLPKRIVRLRGESSACLMLQARRGRSVCRCKTSQPTMHSASTRLSLSTRCQIKMHFTHLMLALH
jgi:hypothetical protein